MLTPNPGVLGYDTCYTAAEPVLGQTPTPFICMQHQSANWAVQGDRRVRVFIDFHMKMIRILCMQ